MNISADNYPEDVLRTFSLNSQDILGNELTGIYLHGSAALGCFNPFKSDIDLIVVVNSVPDDEQ